MSIYLHDNIYKYHTVTSTNDVLYQMACEGAASGTVVSAGHQSAGKGSYGRSWSSEAADNIYCSLLLRTELSANESAILPIATALGIVRVLSNRMDSTVWIKWPNDIIVCGQKIGGILSEYHEYQKEHFLIIGFGINVNQKKFPKELKDKAGSMYLLEGHTFDTKDLLGDILTALEGIYEDCICDKSLSKYKAEINEKLIRRGSMVYLTKGKEVQTVLLKGINENGSLSVMTSDGIKRDVYAGEVSLRGKRRYV